MNWGVQTMRMTLMTVMMIGLAAPLLSGCGIAERRAREAETSQRAAELASCKQQFDEHHMVDRTNCIAAALEAHMHLVRYPDLQRLLIANDAVLAIKVDAGQMTYAEAKVLHAQSNTQLATEEERRNAVRAGANAAMLQAGAAFLAAQPTLPTYQAPVYQPHSISCIRSGNATNCNEQ